MVGEPHVAQSQSVQGETHSKSSAVHVKSTEVAALLEQLKEHPEVRADRVREVAARLENGDYDTREAARETAERIVDGS